jgi:DNA polymerase-3 subunit delta
MVEEGIRAFNVERLYATDRAVTALQVTEAARTLPMMVPRRVVIVLSAEKMLAPKKGRGAVESDGDEEGSGDLEPLLDYLQNPSPTTSLVFVFSAADGAPDAIPLAKNLRITKALAKAGTLVLCTGLDGGKDPSRWVVERAKAAGLEIDRPAVTRVLQLAGDDPGRVRADVEKLLLFAAGAGRITVDHVAAIAGTPRASRRRLGAGSRARGRKPGCGTSRAASRTRQRGRPVPDSRADRIRHPHAAPRGRFPTRRVPAAVEALFRTDVAMKSSGGEPRILLERLIVELCG